MGRPYSQDLRERVVDAAAVRRHHLWDRMRVFTNGGWLVHRSP